MQAQGIVLDPSSSQQPLRARLPEVPPTGEPHQIHPTTSENKQEFMPQSTSGAMEVECDGVHHRQGGLCHHSQQQPSSLVMPVQETLCHTEVVDSKPQNSLEQITTCTSHQPDMQSHSVSSSQALSSQNPPPRRQQNSSGDEQVVVSDSLSQPPPAVSDPNQLELDNETILEESVSLFENPLQKELDSEIHQQAIEVIQQVDGSRHVVKTDLQRPFDPNLVCPMCRRQFRIGEIQKFRRHVNTCTGTDD